MEKIVMIKVRVYFLRVVRIIPLILELDLVRETSVKVNKDQEVDRNTINLVGLIMTLCDLL